MCREDLKKATNNSNLSSFLQFFAICEVPKKSLGKPDVYASLQPVTIGTADKKQTTD